MVRHADAALKLLAALVIAATTLACGCVVIDPDATLCAIGGVDCACTLGGGCDPGLVCESDKCVDPNGTSTGPAVTTGDESGPSSSSPSTTVASTSDSGPESSESGPQPSMPNFAFVTSTTYTAGALGGLEGADTICQDHADAAGLGGMYRAWISLPGEDARDRLGDASGWVRPDGKPLAIDRQQILDGRFFHPPAIDENGTFTTGSVWTGTIPDGTASSVDEFGFCGGWTADEATGFVLVGDLGASPGWWTAFATQPCTGQGHLVCFGVDQQHDLVVEPVEGRLAFVSAGFLPSTAGRDAADALCQTEAENAGHAGSFLSLLAVNGEAPAARFDAGGPPWVRYDGMAIFPEGDAFAVTLATPFLFDAEGGLSQLAIVWAGSYDSIVPGDDASSCTNWTATTGVAAMFNAIHVFWQAWTLGGGAQECAQLGYSVICLEE